LKMKSWYWVFYMILVILICLVVWAYYQGQNWPALFTPIVLIVAAIIAYRQLEHARHARCAGLLLDIMKWWNSDDMMVSRELIWKMKNTREEILKLYQEKDGKFIKVVKIGQFGECLGVLVLRNYINVKDIWLLFEDDLEKLYQDFGGFLEELKKSDPLDTTFCNFKMLCDALHRIHR